MVPLNLRVSLIRLHAPVPRIHFKCIHFNFTSSSSRSRRRCGYVPIVLRIDNVPGAALSYGNTSENVLVAFLDGSETTGWWYEGAGLYRHASIESINMGAHVATHGITSPAYVEGSYHPRATPAQGLTADQAFMNPTAQIENDSPTASTVDVTFTLFAADGVTVVASGSQNGKNVSATSSITVGTQLTITNPELWSIPRPYLHTLVTSVSIAGSGGQVVDAVNTSVGIRSIAWDAETGLYLNEQAVKMRGFCNHESFTGAWH